MSEENKLLAGVLTKNKKSNFIANVKLDGSIEYLTKIIPSERVNEMLSTCERLEFSTNLAEALLNPLSIDGSFADEEYGIFGNFKRLHSCFSLFLLKIEA